jgi:hypothetical protein
MGRDITDVALQKTIFKAVRMPMIRFYFKLTLSTAPIFLALFLIARALGTTQPPNPALNGFTEGCEDKPQPCWYGIVPGMTTEEEANLILQSLAYGKNTVNASRTANTDIIECDIQVGAHKNLVYAISLSNCDGISLGTLMNKLGVSKGIYFMCPQTQERQFFNYTYAIFYSRSKLSSLYFLSPYNEIDYVLLGEKPYDQYEGNPINYKYRWFGFTSYKRYKQLQPEIEGCYPSGPG